MPWWEFGIPVVTTGLAFVAWIWLLKGAGVSGGSFGLAVAVTVLGFFGTTVALGYSIGRRRPSDRMLRDFFRGSLVAELMTLGLTALFLLWQGDSYGGVVLKSLISSLVFAHLFCLPVLCGAAGLGVSLGSASGVR